MIFNFNFWAFLILNFRGFKYWFSVVLNKVTELEIFQRCLNTDFRGKVVRV